MKGLFIMNTGLVELVYPEKVRNEIKSLAQIVSEPLSPAEVKENPAILSDIDLIFTGWGGPVFDEAFLQAAPHLKAVFYGAGTIKYVATDAFWERDILITTANTANAIPVAEYSLSQILFSLKGGWRFVQAAKKTGVYPKKHDHYIAGAFDRTVGLISLSTVGRKVLELLKAFDLNVLAYDPFVSEEEAKELNVELCSLDEIFKRSDVVSLHSPLLAETRDLITGDHFALMKEYASFINTARGAIVNESEMIQVLQERRDITAVLDVTNPEPPQADSPLFELENVILTPHIAGSEGLECGRMGTFMLEEFKRYLQKEPLKWQVTKEKFDVMA